MAYALLSFIAHPLSVIAHIFREGPRRLPGLAHLIRLALSIRVHGWF